MKFKKLNRAVASGAFAGVLLVGPFADLAAAQTGTEPAPAPSFLKQAGQMLMESAQKKIIKGVNQKLQQQDASTNPQATPGTGGLPATAPAYGTGMPGTGMQPGTGMPGATMPGATVPLGTTPGATVATPAPRQAAPCRSWSDPSSRPIACILCIHGLGLQSNSYEFFANAQSRRGLAIYAIDVRGFGAWMNAGGKTKVNFDDCLVDIKQTLESIRAANPGLPVYVLGESMGGAIALRAASMYPELVDGLISSVPAGERFHQEKTSAKVFLNLLTGTNLVNVGNDIVNQATQNAKLKAQWQGDPLARLNLSAAELIQFQDFMNGNHEAAKKVADMPVLFVQGNGDQLVKPEGTWELFNAVAAKDKSFFAVPGEHLIFEEAQTQDAGPRDQNFQVISSWLSTKVGRRHRRGGGGGWQSGMDGQGGGTAYQGGGTAYQGGGSYQGGGTAYKGGGSSRGGGRRWMMNTQGLESPNQKLEAGLTDDAIFELDRMRAGNPNDPRILALLGRAYSQKGQMDRATNFFRMAMRMGRTGGDQTRLLNSYLLDMTRDAGGNSWSTTSSAMTFPATSRGKVYAFYADWADQCTGMSTALNQLTPTYSDRVDITRVNIQNAGSESLVDQFNVGPIPTVVFVSPSGKVVSTIIGESNLGNYDQAFKALTQTR